MTNLPASVAREPGEDTPVLKALQVSARYIGELKVAAAKCITAFQWMRDQHCHYVPLFDFDVICGALPRLVLHRRGSNPEVDFLPSGLSDHSGATTLRYLMETVKEFVIPPGTVAEILSRQQLLSTSISERAERFLRRIHDSIKTPVSLEGLLRGDNSVDILLSDLSAIAQNHRDRNLLTMLLQRATPAEQYLRGRDGDEAAADVLRATYDHLQRLRPDRSHNNYHDAMNAALVARMFTNSEHRPVPLLVSQTRAVLDLQMLPIMQRPLPNEHDTAPLFADKTFLIVSQGILEATEGRYGIAYDEATLLDKDAHHLIDACTRLLNHCRVRMQLGVPAHELTVASLPDADWDMLLHRRSVFERRWGSLFAPMQMTTQLDRHEYLRLLGAKDWGRALHVNNRDVFNHRLYQFYSRLEQERPADYEIWSLIMNRGVLAREAATLRRAVPFELQWRENDGSLLRRIDTRSPSLEVDPSRFADTHDLQLAAVPTFLSCGAALTVSTLRDLAISPRRYLRITWLHRCDREQCVDVCLELVRAAGGGEVKPVISLFTPRGPVDVPSAEAGMIDTALQQQNAETVQVVGQTARSFADIVPLEGMELQIGVTLAVDYYSAEFQRVLVELLRHTSEIPLSEEYANDLVRECMRRLGVGND